MFEETTEMRTFITTDTICICVNDIACFMLDDSENKIFVYRHGIQEPIIVKNVMLSKKHDNGSCYTLYEYMKESFIC